MKDPKEVNDALLKKILKQRNICIFWLGKFGVEKLTEFFVNSKQLQLINHQFNGLLLLHSLL